MTAFISFIYLTIITLLSLQTYGLAAPHEKRAIPYSGVLNENDVKNTTVERDKQRADFFDVRQACPTGYLPHPHGNRTVCCIPVICGDGYEIQTCSSNFGQDECVACKKDYIQLEKISSFNLVDTSCFKDPYPDPRDYYCPIDDTKKSRRMHPNCSMHCKCKTEECYYGNPCGCNHKDPPCGINKQLNPYTGECEPCPEYSYKKGVGCYACTYNITAFSQGLVRTETESTTLPARPSSTGTSKSPKKLPGNHESTSTSQEKPKGGSVEAVHVVLIALACVIVLLVTGFVIYCMKNKHFNNQGSRCASAGPSDTRSSRQTSENTLSLRVDINQVKKPLLETAEDKNKLTSISDSPTSPDSGFGSIRFMSKNELDPSLSTLETNSNRSDDSNCNTCTTYDKETETLERDNKNIASVSMNVSRPELDESSLLLEPQSDETSPKVSDMEREEDNSQQSGSQDTTDHAQAPLIAVTRPIAKIAPYNMAPEQSADDVSNPSMTSSMTSYPPIHHSVDRMRDFEGEAALSYHHENNSIPRHLAAGSAPPMQGPLDWTRNGPDGHSNPVSFTHETACKEFVQSEETGLKGVFSERDPPTLADGHVDGEVEMNDKCFDDKLGASMGKSVKQDSNIKDSKTNPIVNMDMLKTNSNVGECVGVTVDAKDDNHYCDTLYENPVEESRTDNRAVPTVNTDNEDSFNESLPSGSSVEISMRTLPSMDDSLVNVAEHPGALRLRPAAEIQHRTTDEELDSQASVELPFSTRQSGDGTDGED